MRPMRSPAVRRSPGTPTWSGPTSPGSSRGRTPSGSRGRPTTAQRGRPRPDRPAGSVRLGSGSPAPRFARRNPAGRLRADRLRGRVWRLTTPHARSTRDKPGFRPCELGPYLPLVQFDHPEFGDLPQPHFPSAAVAPDGTAYVAFEDNSSATSGGIGVARSRDGGLTWSSSMLPGVSAYAFEPAIAVNYERHCRRDLVRPPQRRAGDAALTADVWFAHSDNRGESWRQTHVAGPTDLRTAPLQAHNYVGEYQGLAATPSRVRRRLHAGGAAGARTARRTSSSRKWDRASVALRPKSEHRKK